MGRSNHSIAPTNGDWVLLAVAVLAVSTAAPIVVACGAPALAIAFWRCALGALLTAGWLVVRRESFQSLRSQSWIVLAAGVMLALHFATFLPSLRFTSVAAATALVSTVPIWTALFARILGYPVSRWLWVGVGAAMIGVLLITGVDVATSPSALFGDGLALLGGLAGAAYIMTGAKARKDLGAGQYSAVVYGLAAAGLLVACLVGGVELTGYEPRDWILIGALTVLAQLLGHSLVNVVLKRLPPTTVGLALLLEVPGAILVAAVWLGVFPPIQLLPGVLLILAGLAFVIAAGKSDKYRFDRSVS
ncbi:MAG: EamA family transporter [Micrococcales bacterium]|nr:EamA family transporter [Micrococcales bacterium]